MTGGPVTFEAVVAAVGRNAGIVVPPEVLDELGAGRRPPVDADLGGCSCRTTLGVMAGDSMISVSAALREQTGLGPGDPVTVRLTVNRNPREVAVPADLAAALAEDDRALSFFEGLSNSLQRYHIGLIEDAKTQATRERRIARAIGLFLEGRKR